MCHVEMTDNVVDLVSALIKAQSGMDIIRKEKTNPAFKSKYADLASVLEAVCPALESNGIALLQPIGSDGNGGAIITTMIIHTSGQYIRSSATIRPTKNDPQGFGSAVTYGRRYGVLAMLGIAPDDDDDGNSASGRGGGHSPGEHRRGPFKNGASAPANADPAAAYVSEFMEWLKGQNSETTVRQTWANEAPHRKEANVSKAQVDLMLDAMKRRFEEISRREAAE